VNVVFDANVVVAGVCWHGEGWLCLIKLAQRRAFAYGTLLTIAETRETALRIIQQQRPLHNAAARLTWYLEKVRLVEPVPLGKQRSRDPRDDPYISAALGSQASVIVSYDNDLLALEKPFGVRVLRPAQFLKLT
jgi:putative PIN family toxin of toxin-antitoxin system